MGTQNDCADEWIRAALAVLRLADEAQANGNQPLAERCVEFAMIAFDEAAEPDR